MYTALSIYNFNSQSKIVEVPKEFARCEKATLIADVVTAALLCVAAAVLIVLEAMGVHMGLIGTIASVSAGGISLLVCGSDIISLMIQQTRQANQQISLAKEAIPTNEQPEKIAELEEKLKEANAKNERLELSLKNWTQLSLDFEETKGNLEKNLKEANAKNELLEQSVNNLTQKNLDFEETKRNLDTLQETHEKQSEEIEKQKVEFNKLKVNFQLATQQKDKLTELTEKLEQAKKDKEEQEAKINELNLKLTELQQTALEFANTKEELGKAKVLIESQKAKINEMELQIEKFKCHVRLEIINQEIQWEEQSLLVNMPKRLWTQLKKLRAGSALCERAKAQPLCDKENGNGAVTYNIYHFDGTQFHQYTVDYKRFMQKDTDPVLKNLKIYAVQ